MKNELWIILINQGQCYEGGPQTKGGEVFQWSGQESLF